MFKPSRFTSHRFATFLSLGMIFAPPLLISTTSAIQFQNQPASTNLPQWDQRTIINWNGQKSIPISAKSNQNNLQIKQRLHWKTPVQNVNPLYLNELKLALTNQATINNQIGYYDNISSDPNHLDPSINEQNVQFNNQWTNQNQVGQNLAISPITNNQPIQFRSHFDKQQILNSIHISNDSQTGATIIVNGLNLPQSATDYVVEATLSDLNLPTITPPIGPPYIPEQPPLKWDYQLLGTQSIFNVNRQIHDGAKVTIVKNGHPDLWISTKPSPNPNGFNYQNSGDPQVGFLNTSLNGSANWLLVANNQLEWNQDLDLIHQLDWKPLINDRYQYRYQADYDHNVSLNFDLPNLKQRMQFFVDQISNNAKWDNEFFFGPNAFNKAIKEFKEFPLEDNINLLFLNDDQKAKILTWFYQDVIKQVFALDAKSQANRKFNLIADQSAAGLKIFAPKDYQVWIDVEFNDTVLKLEWSDWDGSKQLVQSPIRTKFYLDPDEFAINEQINLIDFNNLTNSPLEFGDQFGRLNDDQMHTKALYQNWFSYQDRSNPFAIFKTKMTYDVFSKSLFDTNLINWQNPKRIVYFSSLDQQTKPLNQWSQLALGNGRFRLIIGPEIKQFFLPKDRAHLKLSQTFQIVNFKEQYDIYYAQGATNNNQLINLKVAADVIDVNQIDPKWILNNLIIYDNHSLAQTSKLNDGSIHNQVLLATNLDQNNFIKLLKPDLEIFDRDLSTGTIKIKLTLSNFGNQPAAHKVQTIKATNQISYQLYDWKAAGLDHPQNKQSFYFAINGFTKNYDLAINANRDLDGQILQLDQWQPDQIDLKTLLPKLIAFNHYQSNNDPLWMHKLLVTRLDQKQFMQLINTKINLISSDLWQGIGEFEIDFSGSTDQIANALNYNNLAPTGTNFQILTSLKNRFRIVNLAPKMIIKTGDLNHHLQTSLPLVTQVDQLWNLIFEQNLISFANQNVNKQLFSTNASDQNVFINSIKQNQVQIFNIKQINPTTIQFAIKFNSRGAQVLINNQVVTNPVLKFTISGFQAATIPNLTLNGDQIDIKSIWDLDQIDWQVIIETLIQSQQLIINEQNQWPSWKLWKLIDKSSLKIIADNHFATGFQAMWNLNSVANINGQQSQNLVIKVEKLNPVANIKAKANQIDLQKQVSMQAIDQMWIWNNLWSFSDQINPQAIFNNHLLTKAQFLQQVQTTIQIDRSDSENLLVTISLKRINPSPIDPQPFVQSVIKINNFANPLSYWNDWQKQTITWLATSAIIGSAIAITWVWIKVQKHKKH